MNRIEEIQQLIIEKLNLEDMVPSDIDPTAPLFGDSGLGLDSVDALELSLALSKQYDIVLDNKVENLKEVFYSVESLAKFIDKQKGE